MKNPKSAPILLAVLAFTSIQALCSSPLIAAELSPSATAVKELMSLTNANGAPVPLDGLQLYDFLGGDSGEAHLLYAAAPESASGFGKPKGSFAEYLNQVAQFYAKAQHPSELSPGVEMGKFENYPKITGFIFNQLQSSRTEHLQNQERILVEKHQDTLRSLSPELASEISIFLNPMPTQQIKYIRWSEFLGHVIEKLPVADGVDVLINSLSKVEQGPSASDPISMARYQQTIDWLVYTLRKSPADTLKEIGFDRLQEMARPLAMIPQDAASTLDRKAVQVDLMSAYFSEDQSIANRIVVALGNLRPRQDNYDAFIAADGAVISALRKTGIDKGVESAVVSFLYKNKPYPIVHSRVDNDSLLKNILSIVKSEWHLVRKGASGPVSATVATILSPIEGYEQYRASHGTTIHTTVATQTLHERIHHTSVPRVRHTLGR